MVAQSKTYELGAFRFSITLSDTGVLGIEVYDGHEDEVKCCVSIDKEYKVEVLTPRT